MEEWFCGRWEWYLRDLPKSLLFHCSAAVLATEPRDSIYLLRPCVSRLPRLRQKNGRRFSERLRWVCLGHLWNFFAWSHRSLLSACLMDGNLLGFAKCMCSRCEIANMHIKTKKNHFSRQFSAKIFKKWNLCWWSLHRTLPSGMLRIPRLFLFSNETFEELDDNFYQ